MWSTQPKIWDLKETLQRPMTTNSMMGKGKGEDLMLIPCPDTGNRTELWSSDHAATPGGPAPEKGQQGEQTFGPTRGIRMAIYNGNSWGSMKHKLDSLGVDVICIQEHRLLSHQIPAASGWARQHRWKGIFHPARATSASSSSGGVAVLVREDLGVLMGPDISQASSTGQSWPQCRPQACQTCWLDPFMPRWVWALTTT